MDIAPLHVPVARRLQTLIYCARDDAFETGRLRRIAWLRALPLWSCYAHYFPLTLLKSAPLDPNHIYILGYHPHGIISLAAFGNFATEATGFSLLFPGITNTLLTLASNFRIPFYRDYIQFLGIASVSRSSCEALLQRGPGNAITIVVGGAQESLLSKPGTLNLVLRKRRGFIKLAIRTGASLVPVLSFGENGNLSASPNLTQELYTQADNSPNSWVYCLQTSMKKLCGFTVPLFHARGVFNYDYGLMPWRHPVTTVVGRPIPVQKADRPTEDMVNQVQQLYIAELVRIWEDGKDKYAPGYKTDLRIVE
ncbi:Diacylglycerol O-acyltransferase 2B [Neolecta irregularis DAH-3]|uniref:Diacylglycerol O-acyltransferase n=1 Tax=Neolecta irregularis (strain DAH-3) TaxID=1198029 RepID=A0A1U7LUJ3_NEOID|nr:Diacylglycerol O-acyltransferase 2B [Neolecta irregularis DAH-3]|eukprot:OLL26212.1 Diacylglycerol O-acyltransferase 2B [Neolecta irregularis DAH-3]